MAQTEERWRGCLHTFRGEFCALLPKHGGKVHESENHTWPMHLPFPRLLDPEQKHCETCACKKPD